MKTYTTKARLAAATVSLSAALAGTTALGAQVFATDLIVQGSACIGFDCSSSESFGSDTLRLKENNLRIHFEDTSASASFPGNDWRIVINDSSNGGSNYFAVEDATGGKNPFKIEAGAPSNTLYVEDDGDVGVGTANPAVRMHIVKGDSPAMRLEQDGSSGFTPQTWDLSGNETNFFIRDVTGGSKLPFRIKPGAPDNSVFIAATGNTGMGTDSPDAALHVKDNDTTAAARTMLTLENKGGSFIRMENTDTGGRWVLAHENGGSNDFLINKDGSTNEFVLDGSGNLAITGAITTTGGMCGSGCDAVFGADYDLLTITEYGQQMWENQYLPNVGPTLENAPINLSDKLGRMLNALEHAHIYIGQQDQKIGAQEDKITLQTTELQGAQQRISTLEMRLKAIESKLN